MFDLRSLRAVNDRPELVRRSVLIRSYNPRKRVRYRLQKLREGLGRWIGAGGVVRVWERAAPVLVAAAGIAAVGVQIGAMIRRL